MQHKLPQAEKIRTITGGGTILLQHEGGIRLLAMRVISRLRGLFRCRSLQHEGLVLQAVELTGQQDQAGAQCDQYRQRETIVQCSAEGECGAATPPKKRSGGFGRNGRCRNPPFLPWQKFE